MTVAPYYADDLVTLHLGDCLEVMAGIADASVDAVVTDPPYGLEFMGRDWDTFKPSKARIRTRADQRTSPAEGKSVVSVPESYTAGQPFQAWCETWAAECLRVLKPGGHLLAFGGTRTWHRLTSGIEDAGFEIRDNISWLYGSGFPKSHDVSKAIDKAAGAEREVTGPSPFADRRPNGTWTGSTYAQDPYTGAESRKWLTGPATEDATHWDGWGTALKPAHEPIVVARKPLAGTVAANVLEHGTGALNIGGCRVGSDTGRGDRYNGKGPRGNGFVDHAMSHGEPWTVVAGRWPPNILLTHSANCELIGTRQVRGSNVPTSRGASGGNGIYGSKAAQAKTEMPLYTDANGTETVEAWDCTADCPVAEIDRQSGVLATHGGGQRVGKRAQGSGWRMGEQHGVEPGVRDSGGASRFFPAFRWQAKAPASERPRLEDGTAWPTVKPLGLMRWLVRLVTPPGGVVLDPFGGSGTTAEACALEGFRCLLAEKDPVAAGLIKVRLSKPMQAEMPLAGEAAS